MSTSRQLAPKTWLALVCLLAPFMFTPAAESPIHSWAILTLTTGTEFHDAKLTKIEPSAIKIIHANGVARIPLELLPDDVRRLFPYDENKAAEHRLQLEEQDRAARRLIAEEKAKILDAERSLARRAELGRIFDNAMAMVTQTVADITRPKKKPVPARATPPPSSTQPVPVVVESVAAAPSPEPVIITPVYVPCPPPPAPPPETVSMGGVSMGPGAMRGR